MNNVTIQEEYSLPSKGQVYGKPFDPSIRLRSMTVAEEMKRLTATESPYKTMADIIEACLETKLPVPVYDLCLGDYQYLLHKIRVVTYGPEYKLVSVCPRCGEVFESTINLDEVKVNEYDESFDQLRFLTLPKTGKQIELRLQTPRDLDNIEKKKKQLKKQFPDMEDDPTLMLTLETMISSIDGSPVNPATIQSVIKKLPLLDALKIQQRCDKLNTKVGVDTTVDTTCSSCHQDVKSVFRFTNEFFRPEVD